MSITVRAMAHAGDFLFVCRILGVKTQFLFFEGKDRFTQKHSALQYLLGKNKKSPFACGSPEEKAAMEKWVQAEQTPLSTLNQALQSSAFLAGTSEPSVADLIVYHRNHAAAMAEALTPAVYCNFFRWFDHVQHLPCVRSVDGAPSLVPIALPFGLGPIAACGAAAAKAKAKAAPVAPKAAPVAPKAAPVAPKAAPVAEDKSKESAEMDISKLDIRVGVIQKCWIHPEAEKLLCEEIEVGEPEPRLISSGLRAFYTPEQMTNRRVLVLCNLKAKALVGFKSHGMVLCASNDDHSKVELLEAPAGAAVGEHLQFAGFSGEPAQENHVQKKKILEAVLPDLRTNEAMLATFRGVVGQTSAGPVKVASLANMHIS